MYQLSLMEIGWMTLAGRLDNSNWTESDQLLVAFLLKGSHNNYEPKNCPNNQSCSSESSQKHFLVIISFVLFLHPTKIVNSCLILEQLTTCQTLKWTLRRKNLQNIQLIHLTILGWKSLLRSTPEPKCSSIRRL